MGSETGDPDERPVHAVELDEYWVSETPVSWATYCRLMDWSAPPEGFPSEGQLSDLRVGNKTPNSAFFLLQENKIRLQYCEDRTATAAYDWHAHLPTPPPFLSKPPREAPNSPLRYEDKPMVAVSWQDAAMLCERLSTPEVTYRLPTEAEWEKAARGGLVRCRYAWGDEPATGRCDCNRYDQFSILPMRRFPPNGYGLFSISGGVWEWTSDWYDAEHYAGSALVDPSGPPDGREKVLRGGSWADCPEVVTVSFRLSHTSRSWRDCEWGRHLMPNLGFRLCRQKLGPRQARV